MAVTDGGTPARARSGSGRGAGRIPATVALGRWCVENSRTAARPSSKGRSAAFDGRTVFCHRMR